MRGLFVSVVATLAFASAAVAQTEVLRGTSSADTKKATTSAPAAQKPVVQKPAATPQNLRGSRYGGLAPSAPASPPQLDLVSPRTISLVNANTSETLSVTYWSDGAYHRHALDRLNRFLRDSQNNQQTEMDPLLFDVVWHTMNLVNYAGPVEVFSAYRSPATNAWLASQSRGVARDSQHMNGNAMDIRFPGVAVGRVRQAARSLQMGGVGFYPRSGFVHLDTGPVRYW